MLEKDKYNQLPESLKDAICEEARPNWGMFWDNEWWKDLEVIEDSFVLSVVFRWLAGREE